MHYYIESDGRLFLVLRDGKLDLPVPDEVPFAVDPVAPLAGADDAWFCVPALDRHPREWPSKDAVPRGLEATDRVREAVHASMPRVVVEGICRRGDRVLLVKGNRGLTDGLWTLPGGFLRFGETPEQGVLRELREEAGLEGAVEALHAVRSRLGRRSRLHWVILFYAIAADGPVVPNPDEIAEARYVDPGTAAAMIGDEMMAAIVRDLRPTGG